MIIAGQSLTVSSTSFASPALIPTFQSRGSADFAIVANASTVTVPNGSWVDVNLTVTSLNGFEGPVKFDAFVVSADSQSSEGLYLFWDHSSSGLRLTDGGTAHALLAVDGYQSHFHGISQVWVEADGICLSHRISLTVVQPPLQSLPTFGISVDPASFALGPGSSGSAGVSITGVRGLSGVVSLIAIGANASVYHKNLLLPSGGTEVSELTFQAPSNACPSTQDILIIGTEGAISQSTTVRVTTPTSSSSGGTPPLASQIASLLQSLRANALIILVALAAISGSTVTAALVLVKRSKHD